MLMISPLHRVIDAGRWNAERLLGRLIIVVHAAFLDAGFVPVPHRSGRKPGPVPRQAGRTASALSLRYGAPQLLHRQDAEAAVLRILAHGRRHVILYVHPDSRAASWFLPDWCHYSPETSWKERYVMARRWNPATSQLGTPGDTKLEADLGAGRRNRMAAGRGKRAAGRGRLPASCVQENRRRGTDAIHARSSWYRWKHR
uniref:Uncharacterized protein n=1 Tax=Setaria italica TaxID=4555 RepID=K3ZEE3_SETIT